MNPAGRNNVVALKPTTGLVSRDAIIPASCKQDTVRPFSRTIKDSAYILIQLAGQSLQCSWICEIPFEAMPDFAESCQNTSLSEVCIVVPTNVLPGIDLICRGQVLTKALELLNQAGALIRKNASLVPKKDYERLPDSDR